MADKFLEQYPWLKPFVLSDVRFTDTKIGGGAYSRVDEVNITLGAAAKRIVHDVEVNAAHNEDVAIRNSSEQFVTECRLMSSLRHPNIVLFLGVAFSAGSRLPALVMERMLTNLHDLLIPDELALPDAVTLSMALKCSILNDVACGLSYLHERPSPIVHRNLSAKNVLLDSELVAKIADLGVARTIVNGKTAAMTNTPRSLVYMPPEACESKAYDATIDIFSFGVIGIFTIGGVFPCNLPGPTYVSEEGLEARTELDRRGEYMQYVNKQLRNIEGEHSLIQMIEQCLQNRPASRPRIGEVLQLLEKARAVIRDEASEKKKSELIKVLQTTTRTLQIEDRELAKPEEVKMLKEELEDARAQIKELESRLKDIKDNKLAVQEQANAAEQRGPSWVVMEEDVEITADEVGRGSWAVVKVAKLKVAAKCLHNKLVAEYHRNMFIREMHMAARVSHPNLLRFLGVKLDGEMVILTELMPTSLRDVLKEPLPLKHLFSIAIDVARALNYLHNVTPDPIIHRDLSSSNVLLQPSPNEGWLAKVSDYGTANFQSKIATKFPGCPTYTAPESRDPDLQTSKMDIYSFGALLVEMYTGEFPSPENRTALIHKIKHPGILNLTRKCLNEEKDQRPTAAELVDLLQTMQT